jgi:integrase
VSKLNGLKVKNAKPGTHEDGRGLRLVVSATGGKSWVLRVQADGRRREIGLGSASVLGLADARSKAEEVRAAIRAGADPVAERKKPTTIPTFKETALMVHKEHLPSWRNPKHGKQWLATMEKYAFPKLGDTRIDRVTGPDVREVLLDIWLTIPETARRVRQRIGSVLDYAHARGWREQEAPMRSVSKGLPKQPGRKKHYAALPWQDVPNFICNMPTIINATETVMTVLEFTILTAARSGEVRGMTWGEVNLEAAVWTIPAERMKAEVEHRVPLSERAIEILTNTGEGEADDLIFTGRNKKKPLSDMTLTMPLRRAELGITVHGFRSSFRDWCNEAINTPRAVAERCLAHAIEGKTEAAYSRTDFLDKRRDIMQLWADFCGSTDNVTQIRGGVK